MELTDIQLTQTALFFIVVIPTILAYHIGYIRGARKIYRSTMKALNSELLKNVKG